MAIEIVDTTPKEKPRLSLSEINFRKDIRVALGVLLHCLRHHAQTTEGSIRLPGDGSLAAVLISLQRAHDNMRAYTIRALSDQIEAYLKQEQEES